MGYKVDDDTIKSTVYCVRDHVCLSGAEEPRCKPTEVMSGASADVALLQCPEDEGCAY